MIAAKMKRGMICLQEKLAVILLVIKINMFKDNAVNIVIKCVFKSDFFLRTFKFEVKLTFLGQKEQMKFAVHEEHLSFNYLNNSHNFV